MDQITRPAEARRLEKARQDRGFKTAKDAALYFGWNYNTYSQHERGERGLTKSAAGRYGKALRVSPAWLLTGELGSFLVPVVGYVGAGAQAHYHADAQGPFDMVPAPEGSTEHTVAVEIQGGSLGALFDRWLVFYDDVRSPVTVDLIGSVCVVGLPDDRVLVKKIKAANTEGFFHLLSNTEDPIFDVEIAWAAKVKHMVPK